jgi:hypothetical protein
VHAVLILFIKHVFTTHRFNESQSKNSEGGGMYFVPLDISDNTFSTHCDFPKITFSKKIQRYIPWSSYVIPCTKHAANPDTPDFNALQNATNLFLESSTSLRSLCI